MIRRFLHSALIIFLAPLLAAQQANPQIAPAQIKIAAKDSAPTSSAMQDQAAELVPKDTKIELVALESISSKTAIVGNSVKFAVAKDVAVNGVAVIHEGTPVEGTVMKAVRAAAGKRDGLLRIRVSEIRLEGKSTLQLMNSDPPFRQSKSGRFKESTTNAIGIFAALALLPLELPMAIAMSTGSHQPPGKDAVLPRCFKSDYWVTAPANVYRFAPAKITDQAAMISKNECVSGKEKPDIDWSISDYDHLIIE
jgi:hypothetical protein